MSIHAKNMLLVDDDHNLRQLTGEVLTSLGYCVTSAASAKQALELLESAAHSFDVLVTDVCMPDMSGAELIRVIRHANRLLPIVAITGYALQSDADEITGHGVAIFKKPLDFTMLHSHLESL